MAPQYAQGGAYAGGYAPGYVASEGMAYGGAMQGGGTYAGAGAGAMQGGGAYAGAGQGALVNTGAGQGAMVNTGAGQGAMVSTGAGQGAMVSSGNVQGRVVATGDACATDGCIAGGCAMVTGQSTMSFVGTGQGDYVVETTYTYVGLGKGDLAVTQPRSMLWGRVVGIVVLLASAGAALAMFYPKDEPKVQKAALPEEPKIQQAAPAPAVMGECTFWGDPHLKSFDGARPSFYGEGEYYIVKSDKVNIQGRYMGTKYTAGLAATNKIIVGGSFLQGHTIAVGALEDGPILIDGIPALTQFGTRDLAGLGTVSYSSEGRLVDPATSEWEKKVVKMVLPDDVVVEVFRWTNYIDLRITMSQQEGQDGSCGNFNQDPSDDDTESVFSRMGARVPHGELLFNERVKEEITRVEEELLARCDSEKLSSARLECESDLASVGGQPGLLEMKSCLLDLCYGSNEHTLRLAKSLGLVPKDSAAQATE